ncbi:MAG: radical SAM protein [Anaerococcus vaginalis]|uniref:radical SAM protein n=1 Tax=Anaerococcus vaginalis TaxID=33037 RepID=UPI00290B2B4E|nr:radical SAM protein [Anaerococcus vaginalis]MDU7651093.1 radical SAM protein [Anaerococcus vaginalis]
MERYSTIDKKYKREIVLLKARPCRWGKCRFCDYIEDNEINEEKIDKINKKVLRKITGKYGVVEVIDSASFFELTEKTKKMIKEIIDEKNIHTLFFECHWIYRNKAHEIREYFKNQKIIIKTGVETFDNDFRENYLKKGAGFKDYKEVLKYFDSPCLMVGIKGQTKDMIDRDMDIILNNFNHATVNVFNNNSTDVKRDDKLVDWFLNKYHQRLISNEKIDYLYNITDFGVG